MRSIDLRVPAVAGFAILLLAFAPGAKAAEAEEMRFVAGTGEVAHAAPMPMAPSHDDDAEAELNGLAESLADPRMQDGVAAMVERLGETMLDLPVGKFVAAVENERPGTIGKPIREDATIADLAGRDAERLPSELGLSSRQMMAMFSGFASAFATMMPEFEQMGRDLERRMKDIKAAHD